MAKKIVAGILLILVLVIGILLGTKKTAAPTTQSSSQVIPSQNNNANSTTSKATGEVTMTNMMFTPSQITIRKGEAVTWNNKDKVAHTVIADSGNGPTSDKIEPGASYSYTFKDSGSYQYHCDIHSAMHGTIVVQ